MAEFWPGKLGDWRRCFPALSTLQTLILRDSANLDSTGPECAYDPGTVEKSAHGKELMPEVIATLKQSLTGASLALASGDAADAERRAKAITALVRAEREVAELVTSATDLENDDDELCDELLRRLVRYAEADRQGAPVETLERIAVGSIGP
jgi:hypothetical protein